jgi:hypothetical protein
MPTKSLFGQSVGWLLELRRIGRVSRWDQGRPDVRRYMDQLSSALSTGKLVDNISRSSPGGEAQEAEPVNTPDLPETHRLIFL